LYLHQEGGYGEEIWANVHSLAARDVRVLSRYCRKPAWLYYNWCNSRMIPWLSNRYGFLSKYAPVWLPWDFRCDDIRSKDRWGWTPWHTQSVTPEEYRHGLEVAHGQFSGSLNGFRVTDAPDRAMRDLLNVCQQYQIPVTLF